MRAYRRYSLIFFCKQLYIFLCVHYYKYIIYDQYDQYDQFQRFQILQEMQSKQSHNQLLRLLYYYFFFLLIKYVINAPIAIKSNRLPIEIAIITHNQYFYSGQKKPRFQFDTHYFKLSLESSRDSQQLLHLLQQLFSNMYLVSQNKSHSSTVPKKQLNYFLFPPSVKNKQFPVTHLSVDVHSSQFTSTLIVAKHRQLILNIPTNINTTIFIQQIIDNISNMKSILTFLLMIIAQASTINYESQFALWKKQYGFKFNSQEDSFRQIIFIQNLQIILEHNEKPDKTYTMGINRFTALTQSQYVEMFLNKKYNQPLDKSLNLRYNNQVVEWEPIDWVSLGKVSPIKKQGDCGSCWTFSAAASMQSLELIKNNRLLDLSEQQLLDCTYMFSDSGCTGGYPIMALYYTATRGLTTQSQYPYVQKQSSCKKNGGNFKINNMGVSQGCDQIASQLQIQPLIGQVDADSWRFYKTGIYNGCTFNGLNHGILIVGIEADYWKIKNSYGSDWGQAGYIRISTLEDKNCGICTAAFWPI